jgi:hypothetical protein
MKFSLIYLCVFFCLFCLFSSSSFSSAKATKKRFIDNDAVLNVMVALGRIRPHESVVFDFGCVSCSHSLYFKSLHVFPPGHHLQSSGAGGEGSSTTNVQTNKQGAGRVVSIVSREEETPQKVQWIRDSISFRSNINKDQQEKIRIFQVNSFNRRQDQDVVDKEGEIASILRREQQEKPHVHTRPDEYEEFAASKMDENSEHREAMLTRHALHHVPSVVFLRLRSKEEANSLAPILFKNLKHGSRIVSLNFPFDKYQAMNTFVVDNSEVNVEEEEEEEEESDNTFDDESESEENIKMPHPRAIFVYIVSHEQSSGIPHDIGRFAKFRISLSEEQILMRETEGASLPVGEMWHHRFLTSRNIFGDDGEDDDDDEKNQKEKKESEDSRSRSWTSGRKKRRQRRRSNDDSNEDEMNNQELEEEQQEEKNVFFHGVLSDVSIEEDPIGKFDHCLVTIGTKNAMLQFVKFQQDPTHQKEMNKDVEFEFRLLRADTNEHLTGWVSNRVESGKGGELIDTFLIPHDEIPVHAPFDLAIEFKFTP